MAEEKNHKSCVYPCPGDCGETARYVQDPGSLSVIKETGIAGYDLVYIANTHTKQVFLCGTPKASAPLPAIDPEQPVHEEFHQRASRGEVVSYEWHADRPQQNCFFQSTLIPLRDEQGNIGSVLGLVKNITHWAGQYKKEHFLKEVGRRTFPQILLMAREEERRQISSALHDEIGSAAVILTSLLSMVKQSVQSRDQSQALKDIAALDKQIKDSIERIKNIVVSMRPPNLETIEIEEALRDMLQTVMQYRDIKHTFTCEAADDKPVSGPVKIVLYRVAQESLNNILKHAQASRVDVLFKRGVNDIELIITDNGKGFNATQSHSIKHIGLLSMRDSVAYVGGKFKIKSEPGKGTVIEVKCPKVVYGESSI